MNAYAPIPVLLDNEPFTLDEYEGFHFSYEEWTFQVYASSKTVYVKGPENDRQDFEIGDGDLLVDVHPMEQSRGYGGDCASTRRIPLKILTKALQLLEHLGNLKWGEK